MTAETRIHPTAIVDPSAEIGVGVSIGPYTVVEGDVAVAEGCEIGSHVLLATGARLARNCRVFKGAVIGTVPQDLKFGGEKTVITIGEGTTVREFCTLNRGTNARGATVIGGNCLLMAYCHVAHDCRIGDGVIIANNLAMAGHVDVGNNVNIGGVVSIHQFCRIGDYAFVGANTYVNMDVAPYSLTSGEPSRIVGINKIGLERRGFDAERREKIKRAFKTLLRDCGNVHEAIRSLEEEYRDDPDVRMLTEFARQSKRGLMRMGG